GQGCIPLHSHEPCCCILLATARRRAGGTQGRPPLLASLANVLGLFANSSLPPCPLAATAMFPPINAPGGFRRKPWGHHAGPRRREKARSLASRGGCSLRRQDVPDVHFVHLRGGFRGN